MQNGNKNNEIEADKIFAKHLKNTIFDYGDDKEKNDFGENSYTSDYESSNTSCTDTENINNIYKREKKKKEKLINNDKLYYGILLILGLFSIKTLFGVNKGIFSFDNVINILILISIGVILFKSKK